MLSRRIPFILVGVFLTFTLAVAHTDITRIELGDRVIQDLIDSPKGEGPHPFVIIAAGADGNIRDRLYEKLASAANANGFVTLRLDWTYKTKHGTASADLKREAEELSIIITEVMTSRMMKQYEIDPAKVALITQGLGAKVAMLPQSAGTSEKVKATLLLNPDCENAPGSFGKIYAPFLAEKTPRMIVATRENTCPLSQIYSVAKDFGDDVTLFTLEGNSQFVSGKNFSNQDAAITASINWLRNRGWNPIRNSSN